MTYRSVLANREFSAMLVGEALSCFGDQVARVAVAILVFERTHSPLAASATYAVTFFGFLLFGPFVSTLSDRLTRRAVMVTSDLARAALMVLLAIPDLSLITVFVILVGLSGLAPAFESARSATLPDILPGEEYARGQALLNITFQGAQVSGFVAGGALLAALTISQLLVLNASTFLLSAGLVLGVLLRRPPAAENAHGNMWADTRAGLRIVTGDPALRRLLAFALLGAAAVAAPEGLAVAIAADLHGGSLSVGVLTASIPAGFVIASALVLRLPSHRRLALLRPLTMLAAVPLVLTPFATSIPVITVLWICSGLGTSLQLVASTAYGQAAPPHARARAFGLAGSALMAAQGLSQLAVGALAGWIGSRASVSVFALFILFLLFGLKAESLARVDRTQEDRDLIRGPV